MQISASRLQASLFGLRPTKLLFPDKMVMDDKHVTITRRKWLGLGKSENEVLISKIASVRLDNGILNATAICETQGGANVNVGVNVLPKGKAGTFVKALRQRIDAGG